MRKLMSLCLMLMCQLSFVGQTRTGEGSDYNPNSPGDPQSPVVEYTLVTKVTPQYSGSTNYSSGQRYTEGSSVYLRAYANTGFRFVNWKQGDSVVSTSSSFYYTMPAKDVTLTAVFNYDPNSPADPDAPELRYLLTVEAQPKHGGSFNVDQAEVKKGETQTLYAYTNTGYRFIGWKLGDSIVSKENRYTHTMDDKDTHFIGMFEYNPTNPENPGKNSWNKTTGEMIVDDFTPGYLSDAIYQELNKSNSNRDDVTMIVVAGQMNSNDFGIANNYYNCTLLDLSRTYGYTEIPSYAYDYNDHLQHIILPANVEKIGNRAFYQCTNLSEVSCYAMTPPTVGSYAFEGVAEGVVLYVLSAAIPLYAEAEGWKDFTILPLTEEVRTLEVNLPAGSEDGRYKNMTLELVNAESGHKQKYVISDRVSYTFNGLLKKSLFHIYVRNSLGFVLGQMENVAIEDEDVSVTFETLLQPQDVSLSVLTAAGEDVTNQVQITWVDANGTYLSRGNTIKGVTEGVALTARVVLPQTLGMSYIEPTDIVYIVKPSDNNPSIVLEPLPQMTISGVVKDAATGSVIPYAVVSVSQKLNGKHSKAFTAKADNKGVYTLTVYDAPSAITYSASDYISQTADYENFSTSNQLEEVVLKSITGATITTSFTYRTSVEEGATPDIQNWYSDYVNIAYSIYNRTQQKPINDFSVQYPSIVLLEEVAEGDELQLTATSKNGAFVAVETTAVIDADNRAEAIFDIVELGGIKASFGSTDNAEVVGILYNANGELMKKYSYSSATLDISGLQDGKYTLVTMGSSTLFNSIYNLSQLASTGLKEGTDYVKNMVMVESGLIATIHNEVISKLDESKLYYTGSNTMFSVNKTSVTAGNYLTLKGKVDFKDEYASEVSGVSMVVDLPESAEFVENSVMVGSNISSYTLDGTRLTIPLERYTDQVRFCIIPTVGGDYAPNAFAQFTIDGKEVLQPIGSAHYTIKDLSISVPDIAAKTSIPVSGTAYANSTIQIYDNDVLIGETTSLANGVWSTTCELNEPYNLSTHRIYAKVTTKQGLVLQSETRDCMYDMNSVEVRTVTMSFYNGWMKKNIEVVFDFENNRTSDTSYSFYTGTDVTFAVDLTNNDTTVVSDVNIYVFTDKDEIRVLPATYDGKKDKWVAVSRFESNNLPINVSVDFVADRRPLFDASLLSESSKEIEALSQEFYEQIDLLNELFSCYEGNLTDEEYKKICDSLGIDCDSFDFEIQLDFSQWNQEEIDSYLDSCALELEAEYESMLSATTDYTNWFSLPKQFEATFGEGATYSVSDCAEMSLDSLLKLGYEAIETTGGDSIFILSSNKEISLISFKENVKITIVLANPIAEGIGSVNRALLPDDFKKAYEWIKKARETVNTIYGDFIKRLMIPENRLLEQIESLKKYIAKCERYLRMCNEGSPRYKHWSGVIKDAKATLATTRTVLKYTKPLLRFLARCVPIADYLVTLDNCWDISSELSSIYLSIPEPCPDDQADANWCKVEDVSILLAVTGMAVSDVIAEVTGDIEILGGAVSSVATGGTSLVVTGWGIVKKVAAQVGKYAINFFAQDIAIKHLRKSVAALDCYQVCQKCGKKPCICGTPPPTTSPITPIHDPSGYVYEGVSSNRVEGVTASCYYKETVEDMYGDLHENVVLWDATEYAQVNPLFTDENGMYAWDVPQGLWQVKFEKEGYETTYSEWLPVPPPQLEVNVAITQNKQPEVVSVHAYEEGVVVEFDKYMQPATLNTDNIFVVQNGEKVAGTVTMLNEEIAYRDENVKYASKVRFVFEQPLTAEEVTFTVSNRVKSYAGMQMQDTYTQTLDVEKEIKEIVADDSVSVYYGSNHTLTVKVFPAEAAAGKTLMVVSLTPMILSVDAGNIVLDNNGEAVVKVFGELPGTGSISYSIAGYDYAASTTVKVEYSNVQVTANPTASIASGATVEKGTEVTLHCATEGATIYYTLDGSCPCDDSALLYDGTPIVINEDTELRIMAVAEGRYESDVVVYRYYVKNDGGSNEPVEVTIYKKWDDVLICDNSSNEFVSYQWYKDGMPIDGETNQYYSEAGGLDGSYYVMAQNRVGEWGASNIIICEKREMGGLKVTPTIVKRNEKCVVSVDCSDCEDEMVSLNVFNAMGQIVKRTVLSSGHSVELEFEQAGQYFIKAVGLKENIESGKVIVIE